jgi:WD40 repeat protein
VVGGINGDVSIYDTHGSRTQLLHHQDRVSCMCAADRGRVLVTGGDDGEILVHHFAAAAPSPVRGTTVVPGRWEHAATFKQASWITAMAAVTPAWVAAAGYENAVYIYDVVDTLAVVRRFAGHTQYVTDMCPFEGNQLATASLDGTVRVWKCQAQAAADTAASTSEQRGQQSHGAFESRVYGEAKGAVVGIQWTQDNLLLAASLDLSVYLVDGVTMQTMATVKLPAATFGTGIPLARALGPSVILVSSTGSRVLQGVNVFNGRMLFEIALPPSAGELAVVSVLPQGLAIVGTSNGFAFVVDTTLGVLCGAIGSQERAKVSSAVVAVEAASRAGIESALGYQGQDSALTQYAYVVQDARLVRKVSLSDLRAVATEHAAAVEQHEAATAAITAAATAPLRAEKV